MSNNIYERSNHLFNRVKAFQMEIIQTYYLWHMAKAVVMVIFVIVIIGSDGNVYDEALNKLSSFRTKHYGDILKYCFICN